MQNRSGVINKLALVLLSIVVLELVLIGDQVQPVKSIKKKIALKKLKKLLPLLALVKPKKKIIVVPIPFPFFKNHGMMDMPMSGFDMPMMMDSAGYGGSGGGGGGYSSYADSGASYSSSSSSAAPSGGGGGGGLAGQGQESSGY